MTVSIGLLCGTPAQAALTLISPGDPGVFQLGNSLYTIVPGPSWLNAEAQSQLLGAVGTEIAGHLVTINSQEENDFIYANFQNNYQWIGFTDQAVEGDWVWSSGQLVTYTNWNAGEPNNGFITPPQNYGAIVSSLGGKWDDGFSSVQVNGIAEIPYDGKTSPNGVPGPLPIAGFGAMLGFSRKLKARIEKQRMATYNA
ncbi:C-type lectin domain-containing protein [Vulcanococcus limneticus]|uniref:C-type lectin domain-containing protein n=1 Tax=Vulcanococcus limneticus TaxID=2170428 RepID=UPI00398BBFC4